MSVSRRTGAPGKADWLFSRIVRSRGRCQYPGCESQGPYDTAHLIGRRYSATRCMEDNAVAACRTHHQLIDGWWDEKMRVVEATCGIERFHEMKLLANAGVAIDGVPVTSKIFWAHEVHRLTERCRELDIDTRRSA